MRALLGLGISLALLLLDGAAQAQAIVPIGSARRSDAESAWEAHPLVLEVHLGLGMPLGLVGVAADYSVLDWWAVGVGGGVNNAGPQGAVLSRIRVVGNLRKALTVEAGYSLGNYQHGDFFDDVGGDTPANGWDTGYELRVSPAHFIYLGPGYESRSRRLVFRLFAGLALMLNPGTGTCITNESRTEIDCGDAKQQFGTADATPIMPFVGIAGGYALQ